MQKNESTMSAAFAIHWKRIFSLRWNKTPGLLVAWKLNQNKWKLKIKKHDIDLRERNDNERDCQMNVNHWKGDGTSLR